MRRYYQILELSDDATEADIEKAYKRMASKYHPDKNIGNEAWAAERFKEIKEAYECLIDPERRQIYDETGDTSVKEGNPAEDLLLNILNDVVDNHDLMCEIVARTKHVIEQMIEECMERKFQADQNIVKLQRLRTKIQYRGKGVNLIEGVIDSKLAEVQKERTDLDEATTAAKGVYDMLKDYLATDKPARWTDVTPGPEEQKFLREMGMLQNMLASPKKRRRGGFFGGV